ncbi:MAG: phosphatase PAP2 family protein [Chlorobi bacterium CHB2]|nr:phosphatase PAP2 family protein [Chlorobi bacterium CHB2]
MNTTLSRLHRRAAAGLGLAAVVGMSLLSSCDKTISQPEDPTFVPTSNDVTGGTWKTYVVNADSLIAMMAPLDSTDNNYKAELNEIKQLQSALTSQQMADIKYWSAGAVLRWNEVARNLVIKYNVAPVVGAAPNPMKPFAHPPFASRAYALLSVAQYDALVCSWNAKFKFGRRAPFHADAGIKQIVTVVSDLPSYPSEHAAVARASAEVLKYLFPGDSAQIEEQAGVHMDTRVCAGANVRSEVRAADSLGRAVAAQIVAYAKTDNANKAGGDAAYWTNAANFTDPTKWKSLEIPFRGGMTPEWGKVRPWNVPDIVAIRPGPPPALGSPEFNAALKQLRDISDDRSREQWRISDFWADGGGTSTPPGHWNIIAEEMIREHGQSELRAARTLALLNTAMMDAGINCWDAKYFYMFPRPSQMDPEIKTATGLPNFPSYTSGHSTFSMSGATVLGYVFPDHKAEVEAMAAEAGISRIYGGIHYNFDNDSGAACGNRVGQFAIARGRADGSSQ